MNCSFNSRVSVAPGVVSCVVGDDTVLLNTNTGLDLQVDRFGKRMWMALASSPSIQDAYESLLRDYDATPARLRNDLADFVGILWLQSLIEFETEIPPVAEKKAFAAAAVLV